LVASIATSGDDLLRQSFADQAFVTEDVYAGYHLPLQVKGWEEAFWNFSTAPRKNNLVANLGEISQPVLLITGDSDTVVPTSDTVKLKSLIPGSALEIIPNAGHLPQEERPAEFLSAVATHWSTLSR
jgi:pimeloyl-ACP methyl ester carboxylesterase